jgi:peptide/nickel transport system substrate-binding protein
MWAELNQYVVDQMWIVPGIFSKTQEIWGSGLGGIFFWEPQGAPSFGDLHQVISSKSNKKLVKLDEPD